MMRERRNKRIIRTVLLSLLLMVSMVTATVRAEELVLDFTFLPVADEFQPPIKQAMESGKALLPSIERFTVSSLRSSGNWMNAVLVPTSAVDSGWEDEIKSEEMVEILAYRDSSGIWSAYIWGSEEYLALLQQAPKDFIAISDADTFSTSIILGQKLPVSGVEYKFPWTNGQCWTKTQGWHTNNSGQLYSALDFIPQSDSNTSTNWAVLASAPGRLESICSVKDDPQTIFLIRHTDGTTQYVHLDTKTIRDDLIGKQVERGQFLGLLYNGTVGSGFYIYKGKNTYFQYNTKCGKGTGRHLHFQAPNFTVTVDGHQINTPPYCSSNVRIDDPGMSISSSSVDLEVFKGRLYATYVDQKSGKTHVASTLDGVNWEIVYTLGPTLWPQLVVYNGRLYLVYVGSSSSKIWLFASSDGTNWEQLGATAETKESPELIVYNGRLFLMYVGKDTGKVWITSSTDGIIWENWNWIGSTDKSPEVVLYNDTLYLAYVGNNSNKIWIFSSTDGTTWKQLSDTGTTHDLAQESPELIVYNGRLFLMYTGKNTGKTWITSSTDGIIWENWKEWGPTNRSPKAAIYNGKLYLAYVGSSSNKIWVSSSNDGINWENPTDKGITLETPDLIEYMGKLYLSYIEKDSGKIWAASMIAGQSWVTAEIIQAQKFFTITSLGGEVISEDTLSTVKFPAGAVAENIYVSIAKVDGGNMDFQLPEYFSIAGNIYEFTATTLVHAPVTEFNTDLQLTFRYDLTELAGGDEQTLQLYYYDEITEEWIALPSTVDTVAHTVTGMTNHFTKFAILYPVSLTGGSFVREDWLDVNKSLSNPDDDWMCWAAAAANILDWAGWGTALFDSALDMFYTFQNYWTNAGGLMQYGWQWWFDGANPPEIPGWARLNQGSSEAENGGGYWEKYDFFDYFAESWAAWDTDANQWSDGSWLMASIDGYLNYDYGVTLAVYSASGGHALSAWGYEYDEWGNYTGLYVTDSDDYLTELHYLPVMLDMEQGLWYLSGEYEGWFIGGVQALSVKPIEGIVPEPGTFILMSLGLFLLLSRFAKRRRQQ